jgi:hypothetical protein
LPVEIGGYGAAILRYPDARDRQRMAGGKPTLPEPRPLAFGAPTSGHGRYVDGSLAELRKDGRTAWTATGVLTESRVDTFQFVRFPFRSRPICRTTAGW